MLGVLREIRKIHIGQIDEEALHVVPRQLNEVAAHAVADTTRPTVEHEPDVIRFVQADFNEVVARTKRAQVIRVVAAIELGVLGQDRIVSWLHSAPHFQRPRGNVAPCAAVACSAMVRPPVRDGQLYRVTQRLQVVGQVARTQARLNRHHAASDVHAHSRGNNRSLGGNHAAHRRPDAPMHVGHGRNPLKDKRHLRGIEQLLARLIFDRHTLGPGFHRDALVLHIYVVALVCHIHSPGAYQFALVHEECKKMANLD